MVNDIETETFYVQVTSKKPLKTVGMKNALKIAQEELLKNNLKHSTAIIMRDNGFGYPGPTAFIVRAGGCYAKPADAVAHGWPFTVFDGYEGYVGHVNMDGTFAKEGA